MKKYRIIEIQNDRIEPNHMVLFVALDLNTSEFPH